MKMINLLLYIIIIFIYIIFYKNKTFKKLYPFIVIGYLSIITFFGNSFPDNKIYSDFYTYVGDGNNSTYMGIGWLFICKLFYNLGFNFILFKTFIVVFGLIFLYICSKKSGTGTDLFFILYLLFPSLLDIIQVRYFLATCFIIASFIVILTDYSWKNFFKSLILILIAISIHNSCFFFLIVYLIPIINKLKNLQTKLVVFVFLTISIFVFKNYVVELIYLVLGESQRDRINAYINNDNTSLIGMIIYSIFYFFQIYIIYICKKNIKDDNKKNILENVESLNVLILLSLVLVYFDSDFMRYQRTIFVFNLIIFTNYFLFDIRLKNGKLINSCILQIVSSILYFILFILIFNYDAFSIIMF